MRDAVDAQGDVGTGEAAGRVGDRQEIDDFDAERGDVGGGGEVAARGADEGEQRGEGEQAEEDRDEAEGFHRALLGGRRSFSGGECSTYEG